MLVSSKRKRTVARSAFAVAVVGATLGVVSSACVNPRDDYDDFLRRTGGVRGVATQPAVDAAVQEAAAIDGGFSGASFSVACLPRLVGGKLLKALRFAAIVSYTPTSTSNKAGTIDIDLTPIVVGATELSSVVGEHIPSVGTTVVNPDGSFTADMGKPKVLSPANPISTNDIVFADVFVKGILLRDDYMCAELDGDILLPTALDLNDPGDFCVFKRVPSLTGPIPEITEDEFQHCP